MKNIYFILFCLVVGAVFAMPVWDLQDDFSKTENPNGPWSYGIRLDKWTAWDPNNAFTLAPTPMHNAYGYNDVWIKTSNWPPQHLGVTYRYSVGAGSSNFQEGDFGGHGPYAVRWTAPYSANFRVEGVLWQGYITHGRTTKWTLGKGTYDDGYDMTIITDHMLNDRNNPVAYSREMTLEAGEVIELKNTGIPSEYNLDFLGCTMTITRLGAPVAPEPADESTICEISDVVLSWEESPYEMPVSYDVYFSSDANLPTVYLSDITPVSPRTSINAPSPLNPGTTYYWRVDTYIENLENPTDPNNFISGSVWSFTTPSTVPGAPSEPSDPADNAVDVFIDASLSWAAVEGVCKYDVYLGQVSGNLIKVGADVAGTTYQPSPALDPDTEYFWQVAAKNYLGVFTLGPEWSFITANPFCGQTGQVYNPMDFDKNCYVNMSDFAEFAQRWLNCTDPADPINCDSWNGQ